MSLRQIASYAGSVRKSGHCSAVAISENSCAACRQLPPSNFDAPSCDGRRAICQNRNASAGGLQMNGPCIATVTLSSDEVDCWKPGKRQPC